MRVRAEEPAHTHNRIHLRQEVSRRGPRVIVVIVEARAADGGGVLLELVWDFPRAGGGRIAIVACSGEPHRSPRSGSETPVAALSPVTIAFSYVS